MRLRTSFLFFCSFIIICISFASNALSEPACGLDANPALRTLCDVMVFLQGRLGRSLAVIAIMISAWEFTSGGAKWQSIATLAVGLGMFYAPKSMALYMLPDYVIGITGEGYDQNTKYTPDEIISCICPSLR